MIIFLKKLLKQPKQYFLCLQFGEDWDCNLGSLKELKSPDLSDASNFYTIEKTDKEFNGFFYICKQDNTKKYFYHFSEIQKNIGDNATTDEITGKVVSQHKKYIYEGYLIDDAYLSYISGKLGKFDAGFDSEVKILLNCIK